MRGTWGTHPVQEQAARNLNGQGGLDGVMNVVAVDEIVDAHALLADGVQKAGCIAGQNFSDAGESQHGVQPADHREQLVGGTPSAGPLDSLHGLANAVSRVANGVRKVAIEKQEFQNTIGREVGRIDLAVSFKGGAGTQQAHEFEILIAGVFALGTAEEQGLIDLQHGSRGVSPLKIASQADELPALAVNHGRVADPFEQVNCDLSKGCPFTEPVELVYAALVLEYIDLEIFLEYAPSLVTNNGRIAFVFQNRDDRCSPVSDTGISSLLPLATVHLPVDVDEGKAVRVNVTFTEGLLHSMDDFAKHRGVTRSAFLAKAVRQAMIRETKAG